MEKNKVVLSKVQEQLDYASSRCGNLVEQLNKVKSHVKWKELAAEEELSGDGNDGSSENKDKLKKYESDLTNTSNESGDYKRKCKDGMVNKGIEFYERHLDGYKKVKHKEEEEGSTSFESISSDKLSNESTEENTDLDEDEEESDIESEGHYDVKEENVVLDDNEMNLEKTLNDTEDTEEDDDEDAEDDEDDDDNDDESDDDEEEQEKECEEDEKKLELKEKYDNEENWDILKNIQKNDKKNNPKGNLNKNWRNIEKEHESSENETQDSSEVEMSADEDTYRSLLSNIVNSKSNTIDDRSEFSNVQNEIEELDLGRRESQDTMNNDEVLNKEEHQYEVRTVELERLTEDITSPEQVTSNELHQTKPSTETKIGIKKGQKPGFKKENEGKNEKKGLKDKKSINLQNKYKNTNKPTEKDMDKSKTNLLRIKQKVPSHTHSSKNDRNITKKQGQATENQKKINIKDNKSKASRTNPSTSNVNKPISRDKKTVSKPGSEINNNNKDIKVNKIPLLQKKSVKNSEKLKSAISKDKDPKGNINKARIIKNEIRKNPPSKQLNSNAIIKEETKKKCQTPNAPNKNKTLDDSNKVNVPKINENNNSMIANSKLQSANVNNIQKSKNAVINTLHDNDIVTNTNDQNNDDKNINDQNNNDKNINDKSINDKNINDKNNNDKNNNDKNNNVFIEKLYKLKSNKNRIEKNQSKLQTTSHEVITKNLFDNIQKTIKEHLNKGISEEIKETAEKNIVEEEHLKKSNKELFADFEVKSIAVNTVDETPENSFKNVAQKNVKLNNEKNSISMIVSKERSTIQGMNNPLKNKTINRNIKTDKKEKINKIPYETVNDNLTNGTFDIHTSENPDKKVLKNENKNIEANEKLNNLKSNHPKLLESVNNFTTSKSQNNFTTSKSQSPSKKAVPRNTQEMSKNKLKTEETLDESKILKTNHDEFLRYLANTNNIKESQTSLAKSFAKTLGYDDERIPFIVGQSTSKSFHVGLSIQQVDSLKKHGRSIPDLQALLGENSTNADKSTHSSLCISHKPKVCRACTAKCGEMRNEEDELLSAEDPWYVPQKDSYNQPHNMIHKKRTKCTCLPENIVSLKEVLGEVLDENFQASKLRSAATSFINMGMMSDTERDRRELKKAFVRQNNNTSYLTKLLHNVQRLQDYFAPSKLLLNESKYNNH